MTSEIRRIEQRYNSLRVPIIAVTSLDVPEHRDACLAAGTDEYLTKPVSAEHLYTVLERYLAHA